MILLDGTESMPEALKMNKSIVDSTNIVKMHSQSFSQKVIYWDQFVKLGE